MSFPKGGGQKDVGAREPGENLGFKVESSWLLLVPVLLWWFPFHGWTMQVNNVHFCVIEYLEIYTDQELYGRWINSGVMVCVQPSLYNNV